MLVGSQVDLNIRPPAMGWVENGIADVLFMMEWLLPDFRDFGNP